MTTLTDKIRDALHEYKDDLTDLTIEDAVEYLVDTIKTHFEKTI